MTTTTPATATGWWSIDVTSWSGPYSATVEAPTAEAAVADLISQGVEADRIGTPEPHTRRLGWTLIMGGWRWGAGVDLAAAKREFRKQGGRLSDGYAIVTFPEDTDFLGVDQMGRYRYMGQPGTEQAVHPRSKR